jgi:hypothetical protein
MVILKMIKEYSYKKASVCSLLLVVSTAVLFVKLIPVQYINEVEYWIGLVVVLLFIRYPHEYLHLVAGKAMGIKSKIDSRKLNATCTPLKQLNWYQLFIIAAAPIACITFLLVFFVLFAGNLFYKYLFLGVLIFSMLSYTSDVGYMIQAARYRALPDVVFIDKGAKLDIYLKDSEEASSQGEKQC